MQVSNSHRRTARNLKNNVKKFIENFNGTPKKVKVCTKCLKSGKVERAI